VIEEVFPDKSYRVNNFLI
jgi:hypothetical protein